MFVIDKLELISRLYEGFNAGISNHRGAYKLLTPKYEITNLERTFYNIENSYNGHKSSLTALTNFSV